MAVCDIYIYTHTYMCVCTSTASRSAKCISPARCIGMHPDTCNRKTQDVTFACISLPPPPPLSLSLSVLMLSVSTSLSLRSVSSVLSGCRDIRESRNFRQDSTLSSLSERSAPLESPTRAWSLENLINVNSNESGFLRSRFFRVSFSLRRLKCAICLVAVCETLEMAKEGGRRILETMFSHRDRLISRSIDRPRRTIECD